MFVSFLCSVKSLSRPSCREKLTDLQLYGPYKPVCAAFVKPQLPMSLKVVRDDVKLVTTSASDYKLARPPPLKTILSVCSLKFYHRLQDSQVQETSPFTPGINDPTLRLSRIDDNFRKVLSPNMLETTNKIHLSQD